MRCSRPRLLARTNLNRQLFPFWADLRSPRGSAPGHLPHLGTTTALKRSNVPIGAGVKANRAWQAAPIGASWSAKYAVQATIGGFRI
jgi:hypothetical protein